MSTHFPAYGLGRLDSDSDIRQIAEGRIAGLPGFSQPRIDCQRGDAFGAGADGHDHRLRGLGKGHPIAARLGAARDIAQTTRLLSFLAGKGCF